MFKIVLILMVFTNFFLYADTCENYKQELEKCNSLKNLHERKMCRLGLFSKCKNKAIKNNPR